MATNEQQPSNQATTRPQPTTSVGRLAVSGVLVVALTAWLGFVLFSFDQEFQAGKGQSPEYIAQLGYMNNSPFAGLVDRLPWMERSGTFSLASWTLTTERWGALGYVLQLPSIGGLLRAGEHLLAGWGLLLLTLVLGVWTARLLHLRFGAEPRLIAISLYVGLGYCVIYAVYTVLTMAHLLFNWLCYTLTGLLAVAAVGWLLRERRVVAAWWRTNPPPAPPSQGGASVAASSRGGEQDTPRSKFKIIDAFLLAVLVVTALLNLATVLAPPVLYDTLLYHLALPKVYLQHEGFVPVYNTFFILMAEGMEMLYIWPMSLFGANNVSGGIVAGLIHYAMGIMIALFSYAAARHFALSRTGGLLAACCFLVTPLVGREVGTAYVDVGTAFFTVICLWSLYRYWQASPYSGRMSGWLLAAALFAGMATAVKLFALTLFPVVAVVVAAKWWAAGREMSPTSPPPLRGSPTSPLPLRERLGGGGTLRRILPGYVRTGVVAMVVAGLFASHWYIVSWLVLGSPIWPVANLRLGGWYWSELAEAGYKQIVRIFFYSNEGGPFTLPNFARYTAWDFSLANALVLPRGGPLAPRSAPILTALLPLVLAIAGVGLVSRLRRQPNNSDQPQSIIYNLKSIIPLWFAAAYCFGFMVFWFAVQGQLRYLIFVLPVFGILAGWAYDRLRAGFPGTVWPLNLFLVVALLVTSLANLAFNARAFPVVYGNTSDDEYLINRAAIRLGEMGLTLQYRNGAVKPDEGVLFTDLVPLYYLDRDFVISDPGRDNFLAYETLRTAADFKARLDSWKFGYVNNNRQQGFLAPLAFGGYWAGRREHTHLEYTQGSWYTYRKDATDRPLVDFQSFYRSGLDADFGNVCTLGYDGANPLYNLGRWQTISLDGLDRLSSERLNSCQILLVNNKPAPLPPLPPIDVSSRQMADPVAVRERMPVNSSALRANTSEFIAFTLPNSQNRFRPNVVDAFGLVDVSDLSPWQLTNGTAERSFISFGGIGGYPVRALGMSVPLTGGLSLKPSFTEVDGRPVFSDGLPLAATTRTPPPLPLANRENGEPIIPVVSATLESGSTFPVNGQRVMVLHLQLSAGAQVQVLAEVDGNYRVLEPAFYGSGDGLDDTLVIPLPDGAKEVSRLTLRVTAPQGGTANIRDLTLDYTGGRPVANFVLLGLDLLVK